MSLQSSKKVLIGPGKKVLTVLGVMNKTLHYKEKMLRIDIYIVEELEHPLLSRDASEQLDIVQRLDQVEASGSNTVDPKREYPKLSSGWGHVKIPYRIKLRPAAEFLALMTVRKVTIPLLGRTKT